MQVILPVAGFGSRMRPHTWSRPKPLLHVAGNTVLGHTLDKLAGINVEEIIFITGWLGEQIQAYVDTHYTFKTRYVLQEEMKGQAHAIYLAKEYLSGPCLVIFVDTIFEADLGVLENNLADGVIYVQEVEDPRDFGIVIEEEGHVVRYVEKPETMDHRKTTVGVFWFREGQELVSAIDYMLEHDIRTKGEYYLADAINIMIERGNHFVTENVTVWQDCGQPDTILASNRYLLAHGHASEGTQGQNCVIVPPVYIAPSAQLRDAVIGPHVSIAEGARIESSVVRDCIIEQKARIQGAILESSLVGQRAVVKGEAARLNIGDDATIGA